MIKKLILPMKWVRWSELDQYAFSKGNHKLFLLYQKENV